MLRLYLAENDFTAHVETSVTTDTGSARQRRWRRRFPMGALLALGVFLVCGSLGHATPSAASDFDIRPVRVFLASPAAIEVVELTNNGPEPVVIQTRQTRWSQVDGRSELTDTRDLVVSPPIFEIPPGSRQIVRIGVETHLDAASEMAYRVFFTEVPKPRDSGSGLMMNLSLAVPVFVAPEREIDTPLEWHVAALDSGQLLLRLSNPRNVHAHIKSLTLSLNEQLLVDSKALGYLLAGETREWTFDVLPLPGEARWQELVVPGTRVHVQAATRRGELRRSVIVSPHDPR